jgi:NADH-quinone oxidoreductase subunit E
MFRQKPLGKTHIKVCRTLSCALAGSGELREHFCQKLGLDSHAHAPQTTPDGKFTVEFVECLADCGNAPAVLLNDDLLPKVTPAKADEIIAKGKGL